MFSNICNLGVKAIRKDRHSFDGLCPKFDGNLLLWCRKHEPNFILFSALCFGDFVITNTPADRLTVHGFGKEFDTYLKFGSRKPNFVLLPF